MGKTLMTGDFGAHRLMAVTKGIDWSRPRHEIVIIGVGLVVFWAGVVLKLVT